MIYSVKQKQYVPIDVKKEIYKTFTRYTVSDTSKAIDVGYVDLKDLKNGAEVIYMENKQPKLYKRFGMVADQIELEHCLNNGISKPYIQSKSASGILLPHFKRGKRFINEGINIYLDYILKNVKKGERIYTGILGAQKMYMPINLINELMEKIKINPLLKRLK